LKNCTALVLLGRGAGIEGPKITPLPGLRIILSALRL
jgi:hypothetical protein